MGAVFSIFAGFYYWAPKMYGKMYEEHLAQAHFWTFFIGVNMTFMPLESWGMLKKTYAGNYDYNQQVSSQTKVFS